MPRASPRLVELSEAKMPSTLSSSPCDESACHGGARSDLRARIGAMPIYEYECHDCRKRVSLLVLRPSTAASPACPVCGGSSLSRIMSRFATVKSEEARLDSLADSSSFGDLDENNPASVARFMKKMGREFGDDLGDDFESAMDEAMAEGDTAGEGEGESPAASDASDDQ